jgi:hypothetical protein
MFIEGPLPGQSPDVIFDAGMPASEAKAMLNVARQMKLASDHQNNGDGTYSIRVYTGTPENSTLFWKRTEDRLLMLQKTNISIKSVLDFVCRKRPQGQN